MSSSTEKYVASLIFKLKVYQYKGQQFEDFFVDIMTKSNPDFKAVKAYGNTGDQKNDGFDMKTGTYYQVFAPEDIHKPATINEAVTKLKTDFVGLYNLWNSICPIRKFYFVINDKYSGLPPQIIKAAMELDQNPLYANTKIDTFTASKLQKVFDNLPNDFKQDIIGFIPDEDMPMVEISALQEAINYLVKTEVSTDYTDALIVPDFDKKIAFNGLSQKISTSLKTASYQEGILRTYFKNNPGIEAVLQKKFHALYETSKKVIPDTKPNANDQRFAYILDTACPNNTLSIRTSVMILIAFYFDSCDIFEEPI